jgi:hypothetical protein
VERTKAQAVSLLSAVYSDVDWDVWGKYRKRFWDIFAERVKLCARTTNDLNQFFSNLCARMGIPSLAVNAATREEVVNILSDDGGGELLKFLRRQGDLAVLLARVEMERKRAEKKGVKGDGEEGEGGL